MTINPRRILFAAAEVAPFAKAGGLADVVGALPKELAGLGMDVRVVMPKYRLIDEKKYSITKTDIEYTVSFDGIDHVVRVFLSQLPGSTIPVYLLDHPHYEGVGDIYYQDVTNTLEQQQMQTERFLFFASAVCELLPALNWWPEILHAHDWHAAATPLLCRIKARKDVRYQDIATVMTIHNLGLQCWVSRGRMASLLGLHGDEDPSLAERSQNGVNLLRVGLRTADMITTVSPTYAREIVQPEFGCGMDDVLRDRKNDLLGILNGIDIDRFNPETDRSIVQRYSVATLDRKQANSAFVRLRAHLRPTGTIFSTVSRITDQKGFDLLLDAAPRLVKAGGNLLILGTGDPKLEQQLIRLAKTYPGSVAVTIGFDAEWAQRIYAGADAFCMPSRFEPCGLGQMIAMRYGTIPVVRATGGLIDTVHEGDAGVGFIFEDYDANALFAACERAIKMHEDKAAWRSLQVRAMSQDLSWATSAVHYQALYQEAYHRHATTK